MHKPDDRPLILIVDDTPTNIQVLAEALRSDYRVKVATSGKAALSRTPPRGSLSLTLSHIPDGLTAWVREWERGRTPSLLYAL